MRNKKSVLKTLSVSYDCSNGAVTGIAGNDPGVCEVAVKWLQALQRTRKQHQKAAIAQTRCKAKFALVGKL